MNALVPPSLQSGSPRVAAGLVLAIWLGGCASPSVNPGAPATLPRTITAEPAPVEAPRSAPAPAAPSPLQTEQRWLGQWFRDTPVSIGLADANTLALDVPLVHSFTAGSSNVKPALAAVLDRVATSLKRQPGLRISIAAPSDANGTPALASSRAQQVRDHLVSRGISASRMAGVGTARSGAPVQLRLVTAPQAIGRLDDATLPVPTMGVRPVAATRAPAASGVSDAKR